MQDQNETWHNSPIAWFAVLEDAKRRHDFDRAAEARQELLRLGVEVDYISHKEKDHDDE